MSPSEEKRTNFREGKLWTAIQIRLVHSFTNTCGKSTFWKRKLWLEISCSANTVCSLHPIIFNSFPNSLAVSSPSKFDFTLWKKKAWQCWLVGSWLQLFTKIKSWRYLKQKNDPTSASWDVMGHRRDACSLRWHREE